MASQFQALPKDIAQIAEKHQLGTFSQAYTGHQHQTTWDRLRASAPLAFCAVLTSLVWGNIRNEYPPLPAWLIILLSTAAFLLFYIPGYLVQIAEREDGVCLFEHGIVHSRGLFTILLWTQIARCEIDRGLDECSLSLKDGSTSVIRNLAGYDTLGRRIKSAIGSEEAEPPRSITWE